MCIAVPGEIIRKDTEKATVKVMNIETEVNIQLIDCPKVGDYVLIHAGCAIEKINLEYYLELNNIYERIINWE